MLRTFQAEEEAYKKFKEICARERIEIGDKLNEFIKNYIKEHGDGNPVYQLDKWQDPGFRITPALFSSFEKIRQYYSSINKNEAEELDRQLNVWISIHNKRFRELS